MIYTETKNLPPALLSLLTEQRQPNPRRYSVTALIDSPQIRQLRLRHWDRIEVDPLDNIWMLFGKLLHEKLERHAGTNALTEEKLTLDVGNGETVVGIPDYYDAEDGGTIWDYKTCSTYAGKDDLKPGWIAQLNLYALLLRRCVGFPVYRLRLAMIFRDWSAAKARREDGYPPKIKSVTVPLWSHAEQDAYLQSRLALHRAAASLADGELACTDDERWARPGKFALMKKGAKRAVKLCDTLAEANKEMAAIQAGLHYVEERPAEFARCAEYCELAPFCKQHGAGLTVNEKLEQVGL